MRASLFIGLLLLTPLVPMVFALLLVVGYMVVYRGLELIVIGLLVDTYFGAVSPWPVYTILIGLLLFCSELIKPQLRWYQ